MNVFIAEDEPPALERLVETLAQAHPSARVVGQADSVEGTRRWLATHPPPDVMLMDIQLADGPSLELFEDGSVVIPTIFTTAYDAFALAAFRALAVDYLLKPVSVAALAQAFERLMRLQDTFGAVAARQLRDLLAEPQARRWRQRWLGRQGSGYVAVSTEDVAWFVSLDKLSFAVAHHGARYPLDETLAQIEAEVDPERFFRVNRQMIVSVAAIRRFEHDGKGRLSLELAPPAGGHVGVSQERAGAFQRWLAR